MQRYSDPKQQRTIITQSKSSVGSTATRAATLVLTGLLAAGPGVSPVRASTPANSSQDTAASAFQGAILQTEPPFGGQIPNTKPSASDGKILKTEDRILPFGAEEIFVGPTDSVTPGPRATQGKPLFTKWNIPVYGPEGSVNPDMFLHFAKGLHESTGPLRKTPYVDSNHRDNTPIQGVYVDTALPNHGIRVENSAIFVGRDLIGPADSIFTMDSITIVADRSSYSIGGPEGISVLDFAYYAGSYAGASILFAALSPKDKSRTGGLFRGHLRLEALEVFDLSSYINAKECEELDTREPFSRAYTIMRHFERPFLNRLEAVRDKDPDGYRLALDFANFVRLTYESRGPSPFSQTLREGLNRLTNTP